MLKHTRLEPRFVKGVPRQLEPGVLYVSMEYGTVVHACCCGCGEEVVTPLAPTEWELTYDGEAISLWPSVGNWNLKCRSHYVIRKNRVMQGESWSKDRVSAAQTREEFARRQYYAQHDSPQAPASSVPERRLAPLPPAAHQAPATKGFFAWLHRLLSGNG